MIISQSNIDLPSAQTGFFLKSIVLHNGRPSHSPNNLSGWNPSLPTALYSFQESRSLSELWHCPYIRSCTKNTPFLNTEYRYLVYLQKNSSLDRDMLKLYWVCYKKRWVVSFHEHLQQEVPQGSKTEPLLFLAHTNDRSNCLNEGSPITFCIVSLAKTLSLDIAKTELIMVIG